MEIILYILKWVVSSDLDLRSLEMCSRVCRGFYLCSRDPEIWRLACIRYKYLNFNFINILNKFSYRAWGVNCGNSPKPYSSWRHMFIERSRLHFNGCYISKTTYIRQGENNFQDQFYRPCHLVAYYRYLRYEIKVEELLIASFNFILYLKVFSRRCSINDVNTRRTITMCYSPTIS